MRSNQAEPWQGKLIVMAVMACAFFGAAFALVTLSERMGCVEMPNGFLIGPATVFSSMVGWAPDIAIRYPDGRMFSRGDNTMEFWDEEGFGGAFDLRGGGNNPYVYLNELGLITAQDQPELYKTIFDRKMREHENSRHTSGGHVMRTYLLLRENPQNRHSFCKTDWFLPDPTQ